MYFDICTYAVHNYKYLCYLLFGSAHARPPGSADGIEFPSFIKIADT